MLAIGELGQTGLMFINDKDIDVYAVRNSMKKVEELLKF